ncbi:hypothetical protein KY325_05030 [Candidatus Woesearchaeota archaeon]|nr:hypothetical protein [Candidatus Woesearchaeota archaeon]MBW3018497.1 hypothetical protein [Candidatus Woesearchaeota archaeon]
MNRFNWGIKDSSLFDGNFERGRLETIAIEDIPDTSKIPVNIYLASFDPLTEDPLQGVVPPVEVAHSYVSIDFRAPYFNGFIEVPDSRNTPVREVFYRALDVLLSIAQKEELDISEMDVSILVLYKDQKMQPELEQAYHHLARKLKEVVVFDGTIKEFEEEMKSYRRS